MDAIITFLHALTDFTPVGLAALLGFIIYKLIEGNRQLKTVRDNHLHELPEMAETLRRMEQSQTAAFTRIITLLEHK